ncbi:TonB-dependent receptor plug domain-containing protein [Opitutus terrae]|uniref:TonB-dependent receptor plug n=1 Tax=Opitutus terrae (strain DSM 11246 / JCM 15787 / PB90-1) TaxID=452637 RepID=B1ZSY8_OPITP|nr:TonB-dependent receptor plug domain-containing protein [Opitutus terrae]ACB75777.1 TonB-dependent receptor plug [Opitutus terrae PB90-1]
MNTRNRRRIVTLAALITHGLIAQTVTPSNTPAAGANTPEEDLVVLSPFEVRAETDRGYAATETLAGTRIRTELKDVGSAISVITKELLGDIGATDNGTLLQYTTNAEVGLTRGTYAGLENAGTVNEGTTLVSRNSANRVRGLSAADNTRDFFVTDIPWDSYNVDRIDIQRGPNAMLFGLGKPAGIINAAMRNADFKNSAQVAARYGSYGSWRASLDVNQELVDNVLAVRFATVKDDEKFQQEPAYEDDERYYGTIRFEPKQGPGSRMSLKLKYEHGEIDANRPRTVTPMDAVSVWFKPLPTTRRTNGQYNWTINDGMGKKLFDNPYDVFATELSSGNAEYIPWLNGGPLNAQQPFWLIDGASATVYNIRAGIINNGARRTDGTTLGTSDTFPGKRYATPFLGINTLNGATAVNLNLPNANYGQYRANSMLDPSIFDFYGQLIDGDTKHEFERWDSFNFDLSQTVLDDRLGLQLSYDSQNYTRGGESFLGWQPTIQMDVLQRWDDLGANPNVGRPYVVSGGGGTGNSYQSEREYYRGSLFGELRASDFLDERGFWAKLLGTHRLNAVYSDEKYVVENRTWQRKAFDTDWAGYWTMTNGLTTPIDDRNPVGIIYLGDSIANLSSAAGANIPRITGRPDLTDGNVYLFDTIWTAPASVALNAPWTVPADLAPMFSTTLPTHPSPTPAGYYQNSNPSNYKGWNKDQMLNLWSYDGGEDMRLLTRRQFADRQTKSQVVSWQSFWWDGALVGTLGWRKDEIQSLYWGHTQNGANRKILSDSPTYTPLRNESAETTSGGVVLHVNKLFRNDRWLPVNVSLSYNTSKNFDVTGIRNDLYGRQIPNPTGETKDYGVLISTKDGKYSLRVIKYEATVKGDNAGLDSGFGGVISNGLNWRNVFLYDLAAYDWSGRESPSYRNNWANAFPETGTGPWGVVNGSAEEAAVEDEAIAQWNQIQTWLTEKGFFQAWGFTPVPTANLTTRSTYAASLNGGRDPAAQYVPPSGTLYSYTATAPQNFAVTADTLSKGYEFELVANPTSNWRIAFNASKTEAFKNNVGGAAMQEFVDYMDSMLIDDEGTAHGPGRTSNGYTAAGNLPRWGGAGSAIGPSVWAPWKANYNRLKLNEGAAVPELRKWRFNVMTNYTFREGFLKGVGVGGSYRWQDKVAIGYPLIPNGPYYGFDIANPIFGPAEDAVDLWTSYERKLTNRINWKIQLNVRNAFADNGLIPISVQPDNTTWASVRVKPVQEWFVTNTFTF